MYITNIKNLSIKSVVVTKNIAEYLEKFHRLCRLGCDGDNVYFIWSEDIEKHLSELPLLLKVFGRYSFSEGGLNG